MKNNLIKILVEPFWLKSITSEAGRKSLSARWFSAHCMLNREVISQTHKEGMKLNTLVVVLLGTFLLQQSVLSQTNTVVVDQPAVTNNPVMTNAVEPANPPVDTVTSVDSATTNAAAPAVPSIPTIRFQDVPLTTAIDALAREAGINYLLDPKIAFGQPDANGHVNVEPSLSIRWENITAEQALLALLDNYGLQLVVDPKTKIDRITTKDPLAPPSLTTRVIQLKYASVSNMEDAVTGTLTDKRSRVITDIRTSQLIVVATDREQADVDTLIAELDRPTRQVLIETKLVEISSNPSTQKGIDWTGTLQAQHASYGNGVSYITQPTAPTFSFTNILGNQVEYESAPAQPGILSTVLNPNGPGILANTANGFDPATFFLNADGVHAVLSYLNSSSDAQVVSTPRVVTLDNETATISVTRAFPIFNTTAGTQGSPGGSSITYSNLGTILEVTPRISANDYIRLKVTPNVSSFFATVTKTVAGVVNQADEFDVRQIDTQVLIPNANTLVMGGLVKDSPSASYTKVPILGDIPLLGHAFRSEDKQLDKDNLLIFITPTIVQDTDFHPSASDFLQSRPEQQKPSMNPNGLWDSSLPYDWANPKNTDPTQEIINQKTTQ
jgi:type IV pilus assembly protein PilQ